MKELNELVELAKKADREVTWSLLPFDLAKEDWCVEVVDYIALMSPHTILAIAEAFRALEQRAEAAESNLLAEERTTCAVSREKAGYAREVAHLENKISELRQRAEAAEAKLAELEKQEPIGYVSDNSADMAANGHLGYISNHQVAGLPGRYVYARPAPTVSLAEMVPDERSVKEDEFLSEYLPQQPHYTEIFNLGWNACRAAILRNIEKRETDTPAAPEVE